jgi:transcriptional regulator with XRE-family HTH domain
MKHQYTESDIIRGKAIQYYRRQAGLTQAELAMEIGVSSIREYEWEKGAKPSVKNWHKLCQILKMPLEWLDEDLSDPINSRRMQTAFLRRLDLSPEDQQKLEEALNRYYETEKPLPKACNGCKGKYK